MSKNKVNQSPRLNSYGEEVTELFLKSTPKPVYDFVKKSEIKSKLLYPRAKFIEDKDASKSGTLDPRCLVFHYTASYDLMNTVSYFQRNVVDVHFVVGHDGTIIQMAKLDQMCAHVGNSKWGSLTGLNKYAIGIEVINIGPLKLSNGKYYDYTGRIWKGAVRQRKGLGYTYWEPFTMAQEKACVEIAQFCHTQFKIPVGNMIGHYECATSGKLDPYGGFSMGEMFEVRKHLKQVF